MFFNVIELAHVKHSVTYGGNVSRKLYKVRQIFEEKVNSTCSIRYRIPVIFSVFLDVIQASKTFSCLIFTQLYDAVDSFEILF